MTVAAATVPIATGLATRRAGVTAANAGDGPRMHDPCGGPPLHITYA